MFQHLLPFLERIRVRNHHFRDIFVFEFEFRAELSGQDCLRSVCVRLTLFQGDTLPIDMAHINII